LKLKEIELHGHQVAYRAAGSGPVIVLVHGITSTSETWERVMPTLAKQFTPEQGEPLRLLLGVGVLGGFTTFSAFSLETANMLIRGQAVLAAAYAVSSVAGSVLMLFIGLYLMRAL